MACSDAGLRVSWRSLFVLCLKPPPKSKCRLLWQHLWELSGQPLLHWHRISHWLCGQCERIQRDCLLFVDIFQWQYQTKHMSSHINAAPPHSSGSERYLSLTCNWSAHSLQWPILAPIQCRFWRYTCRVLPFTRVNVMSVIQYGGSSRNGSTRWPFSPPFPIPLLFSSSPPSSSLSQARSPVPVRHTAEGNSALLNAICIAVPSLYLMRPGWL